MLIYLQGSDISISGSSLLELEDISRIRLLVSIVALGGTFYSGVFETQWKLFLAQEIIILPYIFIGFSSRYINKGMSLKIPYKLSNIIIWGLLIIALSPILYIKNIGENNVKLNIPLFILLLVESCCMAYINFYSSKIKRELLQ